MCFYMCDSKLPSVSCPVFAQLCRHPVCDHPIWEHAGVQSDQREADPVLS